MTSSFVLAPAALSELGTRPFGVYVHVPFCATRCGYCDFNTYTAGNWAAAASPASRGSTGGGGIDLAVTTLGDLTSGADTVFVGGGTPSLLAASDGLARVLDAVRDTFGLASDAEVTTESNPESHHPRSSSPGCVKPGTPGCRWGMQSGGTARARGARTRTHPGSRRPGGRRGPCRRVRTRQSRPHLRHAGRDGRLICCLAGGRARGRCRPRVGVFAHR